MDGLHLIDGRWRDSADKAFTFNPSDLDEQVGAYALGGISETEDALAAARNAFVKWRYSNIQERSDILRRTGDMLHKRSIEIGTLLAREEGKPIKEAIGEAIRAAQVFHFFSGEALRHPGTFQDSLRPGHSVIVSYEPVGVIAVITPWNFPIAIPAWKIAAALAYGNTVVLKPSQAAPGCTLLLGEILMAAGLPAGALNIVMGAGRAVGQRLVTGADAVSFTGSTSTGRNILEMAAPTMTKVQLELGGKNPLIVLDDAELDVAVDVALQGTWGQTGQRCTGSERLIVTRGIHDAFVAALTAKVAALRVGHALDENTEIGPVATQAQFDKNLSMIAGAKAQGAELVAGGQAVERRTRGLYLTPALFVGTTSNMDIDRHETFGPIAGVRKVGDLDEAIAVAADCELALSSGICTTSIRSAEQYRRASTAGMVMVNTPTAGVEYHVPFGGRAPSGFGGREQGTAAAEFYTEMKTSYINHGVL